MSGVFGLWRLDGRPVAPATCEAMSRQLAHRGPDGAGVWTDGPLGIGHRMLRTTREAEREIQPLATADGDLVLTADARLDNREALIAALALRSSPREDITDADLILASYRAWGERCVEHWIGDFGVVIWDSRRRRLFCARDPFGVKPLFYHYTPGRLFAFASEVETLLVLEDVPDEIDEFEVARHLLIPIGSDLSATYYRQVRRLMPAHALVVSDQTLETRRYWRLDPTRELRLSNDDEYAEALREAFVEAVRCRLRSATPVACMLSGGIDSASITCVAADLLEESGGSSSLQTLSAVYPGVPESDERVFIEDVLRKYRVVPHFLAADRLNPIAEIDRMNRLVGGANWGGNLYLNWMLYGVATEVGARVVLDGFDGDSTLSHGLAYLSELAMTGRWLKLARTSIPYSRRRGHPVVSSYLDLARYGLRHPSRDTAVGSLARRLRRRKREGAGPDLASFNRHRILNAEFARRFADHVAADPPPPTTERQHHLRKLNAPVLFETVGWLEACGAGRGVDVRLPFCDARLAELCLSFPPDQKIRRGWTRFAMRRAMQGILPPAIQWRKGKTGLHAGWSSAWRSTQDGRVEAMLAQPNPAVRHYLDPERVLELHRRHLEEEPDSGEGRALRRALSLALWLSSRDI